MSRCTALALLALTGCIVVSSPQPDTDDPIIVDPCDADEVFGDGVDQDCDGTVDVQVDTYQAPARTQTIDLHWGPELRSIGGVVELPTGVISSQNLYFADEFGGPVTLKERSDYAVATGEVRARRIYVGEPIDLVADGDVLTAWAPDGSVGTALWTGAWPQAAGLDALVTEDGVWALGCDGANAHFVRLDLDFGTVLQEGSIPSTATQCVVLGEDDGLPMVVMSVDSRLERWVLHPDDGFIDRLVLASRVAPDAIRTVTGPAESVLGYVHAGKLRIVTASGEGLILGDGAVTSVFDLALAADGTLLSAWTDQAGMVWAALGNPPGPVTEVALTTVIGAEALAIGIDDHEIGIAVQQAQTQTFLRAVR